jgi:hypothetical protein
VRKKLLELFGIGKQKTYGTGAINKVEPNVPETKGQKIKRDLALATQKRKTSEVKLDNTIFRINQQKKRLEDMQKTKSQTQTRPGKQNLAKGGRAGLKFGSKKSNVQKIQETFGPKKKVPNKFKGFSKLPEKVQQKIDAKLAKKV